MNSKADAPCKPQGLNQPCWANNFCISLVTYSPLPSGNKIFLFSISFCVTPHRRSRTTALVCDIKNECSFTCCMSGLFLCRIRSSSLMLWWKFTFGSSGMVAQAFGVYKHHLLLTLALYPKNKIGLKTAVNKHPDGSLASHVAQ